MSMFWLTQEKKLLIFQNIYKIIQSFNTLDWRERKVGYYPNGKL